MRFLHGHTGRDGLSRANHFWIDIFPLLHFCFITLAIDKGSITFLAVIGSTYQQLAKK